MTFGVIVFNYYQYIDIKIKINIKIKIIKQKYPMT